MGAEIGVAIGQTSEALLSRHKGLKLYMIDSWAGEDEQPEAYRATQDWHAHVSREVQTCHYEEAVKVTEFAADRRVVMRKTSAEAADEIGDRSLSFVFIDGDHSYEGCMADIEAWRRKVKPGGWLCGHDYGFERLPGVKQAVDEAVARYHWTLAKGGNYTWFVKLP